MASPDEVTLWRAPATRCANPLQELQQGFEPADYPGMGLFFATEKFIAESFQQSYQNGLQEFHMPRDLFDRLVQLDVILPDTFYPVGQSWHVPPSGLHEFNVAVGQGTPGKYHPQQ